MNPFFLPALKARLLADLADLRLDWRGPASFPAPAADHMRGEASSTAPAASAISSLPLASADGYAEGEPSRPVQVFIGDLPPKKRRPGDVEKPGEPFPCVVLIPLSGQSDGGEDAVTVALVCGVYCGDAGDAEGAESDMALLLSRIRQSLTPCRRDALDHRYRLTEDAKGRLFPWEKSDMQPRPYIQATVMTCWRMKGLE